LSRCFYWDVDVQNVAGQLVKTLVNEKQLPQAGGFTIRWDGRNNKGSRVSSGVYFYRLKTDSFTSAKKMVLLQ
jgi:flagellar hook assembly protein FlgD